MNIQEFDQYLNEIVVISDKLKSFIFNCASKSSDINFRGRIENRDFDKTYLNKISDEMKKLQIFNEKFINSVWHNAYTVSYISFKKQ